MDSESKNFRIREVESVFASILLIPPRCLEQNAKTLVLAVLAMDSAKFTTRVSCQEGDSNSHSLLSLFAKEIGTLAAFLCLYQLNLLVLWAVFYAASDHAKQILCFPRLFLLNFPSNFLFNWSHPKRVGILVLLFLYS